MIKQRNIVVVYLLSFITFGIYMIYWQVQTKKEINSLGGDIPTAWLLIVPIANIYWMYKYCEAYSQYVKRDDNAILWFVVYFFASIVMPALVQTELNKLATAGAYPQQPVQPAQPAPVNNEYSSNFTAPAQTPPQAPQDNQNPNPPQF